MKTRVIDVGGTNIKLLASGQREARKIASGASMTAGEMVRAVLAAAQDGDFEVVSIGYPGPVVDGKPLRSLPLDARLGDNRNAFLGGFRLWEEDVSIASPSHPSYRGASAVPSAEAGGE